MRFLPTILLLFAFTGPLASRAVPRDQFYRPGSHTYIVVEDKQTEEPLIGATVLIASGADTLRGTTVKKSSFFGLQAAYECDRLFRDSVTLEVSYVGYAPFVKRYAGPEFARYIRAELEIDTLNIAQVVVTGKQIAMVFRGDTTVYNAGAFRTMADDRLAELLKQLPGIEIRDDGIYADGEEVKRIYVDGRNLFGSRTSAALTDLEAKDVQQVRVYEEQSPEARRTGDNTAEKERVMDVETKSKRGVLWGGELAAMGGASLEEDYSGRHEIRHSERMRLYRHSERGSTSVEASNSKDESGRETASMSSKITPAKRTRAGVSHEYRRGDSTAVWTTVEFSRRRNSSVGSTLTSYFPTDEYRIFDKESRSESLSKNVSFEASNYTMIQRRRNVLNVGAQFQYESGSSLARNLTRQRIDDDETRTQTRSDGDDRSIGFDLSLYYSIHLSERSQLSLRASASRSTQRRDGWQVDTAATEPGLRMRLLNDGDGRSLDLGAGVSYRYKTGEKSSLTLGYSFSHRSNRSKQLSIDFLDNPLGKPDSVNSYDYTIDYDTHGLTASWSLSREKFRLNADVQANAYDLARDERFPAEERSPRTFYGVAPNLYIFIGDHRTRRWMIRVGSRSQVPSAEALRRSLDATNPLQLRAGNPDLKLPTDLDGSVSYTATDAKSARTFGFSVGAGYGFNYIASRTRLFLEETYLPRYDYTAQKGAQLSTQVNAGGSCQAGVRTSYSQQVAALRSTLRADINYTFRQTPYFRNERLYKSASHSLGFGVGFESGFSSKVRIGIRSSTAMSSYTTQEQTRQDLRETVNARLELRFGKYFGYAGTLYEFYCNSASKSLTRHNVVLNASAGRKFGKENRFSLAAGAVDLLNRPDYSSTQFDTDFVRTRTTSYLGRYAYLELSYTF